MSSSNGIGTPLRAPLKTVTRRRRLVAKAVEARWCQDRSVNVWANEWCEDQPEGRKRRVVDGTGLGATLYELSKGGGVAYHFHQGSEELLVVISGALALRTPEGTQIARAGDLVYFPAGPAGTHAITNDAEEPVRYLMVSTRVESDATEYPDTG
jgi:quercetin dioxygenase-like cupin family protein